MGKVYFTETAVIGMFRIGKVARTVSSKRVKLCSVTDYEFKKTKKGTVQRNDKEKALMIDRLYQEKKKELLEQWELEKAIQEKEEEQGPPISTLFEKWLEYVTTFRTKTTADVYRVSVNHYLKSVGDHPIGAYQREFNGKMLSYLKSLKTVQGRPYTQTSVRRHLHQIQIFFNWAFREEVITRQIKLQKPSLPQKDPVVYDSKHLKALSDYLVKRHETEKHPVRKRNLKNHLRALYLATYTIMRRGPIWALKLEHIDLEQRIIRIRHNPEINFVNKKEKEPDKPIAKVLFDFLVKDIAGRGENERYFLDDGAGNPCYSDPRQLTKSFSRHVKALGLPEGVKPLHGIRATGITELIASGEDLRTVKELADHESITTTIGYSRAKKARVQQAVEGIKIDLSD